MASWQQEFIEVCKDLPPRTGLKGLATHEQLKNTEVVCWIFIEHEHVMAFDIITWVVPFSHLIPTGIIRFVSTVMCHYSLYAGKGGTSKNHTESYKKTILGCDGFFRGLSTRNEYVLWWCEAHNRVRSDLSQPVRRLGDFLVEVGWIYFWVVPPSQ